MPKKVLITGASGLIGTKLTTRLVQNGHQVAYLSTSKSADRERVYTWDVKGGTLDTRAFEHTDTIIHLAGASIADGRWTSKRKREILESRTKSSALLFQTLKNVNHQITTVISASAVGYYGSGGPEKVFAEESDAGQDFLAEVVKQWEASVDQIAALGIRVVKVRIGILLSGDGGALAEMAKPVRWGVGSPLGTGQQVISWIHINDVCRIIESALEDDTMMGAYNAVSPIPTTNEQLTKAIARVLKRPLWLPNVPDFVLKIILGEMSSLVLTGAYVSPLRLQQAGFDFKYTHLEEAVLDLLGKGARH